MTNRYSGYQYKLEVLSRTVLGIVGGYALSAMITLWLTRLLPLEPRYAATAANMLFFIFYACAIFWAFANIRPLKAWIGICVPALVLWVLLLIIPGGAS